MRHSFDLRPFEHSPNKDDKARPQTQRKLGQCAPGVCDLIHRWRWDQKACIIAIDFIAVDSCGHQITASQLQKTSSDQNSFYF